MPAPKPQCHHIQRRTFLADVGMGFTGLALGALSHAEGFARDDNPAPFKPPNGRPHFAPKAKNVIWVFLSGGYSQMETFDPKPALVKYGNKTYDQTAFPNPTKDPLFMLRSRAVVGGDRPHSKIFPMQIGYRKHGESGIEVTNWWPHLATCVDDIAFVRSMYTTDNDHNAEFQMHHGRHKLDPPEPVLGSWIHYGLGTLNENLPAFVFIGQYKDTRVRWNFDANYLGPAHSAVELSLDPKKPLPSWLASSRASLSSSISSIGCRPSSIRKTPKSKPASNRMSWLSVCRCRCLTHWTCRMRRPTPSGCTVSTTRQLRSTVAGC
jgi:hypothetical protein